jgi:serine/threonine protein kinase
MEYLHENDIILRDLKPANVGFDAQGKVKLFDFGLARSLHDGRDNEIAGSLRYMAPETVLAYGSDKKSDVYSFGVLLWELCALQRPFQQFRKTSQFKEKVVVQHYRPPVRSMHSRSLETIIRRSWDFQPSNRPTFSSIRFMLDQAMNEIDLKVSRHSTVSAGNTPLTETHPRGWSLRRQASMPAKLPHRDDQEDATPTITNRELSSFFRRNSEAVHNKTDRTKDESASSMSRGSFIRRFSGIFNFSTNGRTSGDESSTSVSGNSCQSL